MWRVLSAEVDSGAGLTKFTVDRDALRQSGNPVVAVIRIDGRNGINGSGEKWARQSLALASDWKNDGIALRGIEIDYDCAVNRLRAYHDFLRILRQRLPDGIELSITALPSWLGRGELQDVLAQVNEDILQVHSVMRPPQGLFDPDTAYKWAEDWSAVSPVPFRLALPTYWSRVTWDGNGRIAAIESETARLGTESAGVELVVDPTEVASLVRRLRQAPPRNLIGIAWFRLPIESDQRAWSWQTWRAVMLGRNLGAVALGVRFRRDDAGARVVYLVNESDIDAKYPPVVSISGQGCELADALPPYDLERQNGSVQFLLKGNNLLRSRQERMIGWVRCSAEKLEARVSY